MVQQQQVARTSQETGGSVLFNPDTNTRIVYRVIYPNELHKEQRQTVLHVTQRGSNPGGVTQIGGTPGTPFNHQPFIKKHYRKRGKDEEDYKLVDTPDLSKEEKEERKKQRPKPGQVECRNLQNTW